MNARGAEAVLGPEVSRFSSVVARDNRVQKERSAVLQTVEATKG